MPSQPSPPRCEVHRVTRYTRRSIIMGGKLYVIAILAVTATLSAPLGAQENSEATPAQAAQPQAQMPPPEFGDPRFTFHRIDGGFVRLDLHTGAVASCSQNAAGWVCIPGREERAALDREIARLQRDNAVLKNALLERGVPLPNDMKADVPPPGMIEPAEPVPRPPQSIPPVASAPGSPKSAGPGQASHDDAEIERVMGVMERVWRRLVEMMMNIQHDLQKKE
jgi:hypothetical protein